MKKDRPNFVQVHWRSSEVESLNFSLLTIIKIDIQTYFSFFFHRDKLKEMSSLIFCKKKKKKKKKKTRKKPQQFHLMI